MISALRVSERKLWAKIRLLWEKCVMDSMFGVEVGAIM